MNPRMQIYNIKEIAADYEGASKVLNSGCKRNEIYYRISGICQVNETVYFPMEEIQNGNKFSCILSPFTGYSKDLVLADIFTRWSSGFITKGLIELSESYPGLFELEANSS